MTTDQSCALHFKERERAEGVYIMHNDKIMVNGCTKINVLKKKDR